MGGSTLDVIALALKIILWAIEAPRSRSLIIMDEPFRFTGKLVGKCVAIVKEISHKLGIQFIINTHSDELLDIADRSWEVTRPVGKKSIVMQTS
jgi:DNA mismatch repair ATPase MutS